MLRKFFDPALREIAALAESLGATMLVQSGRNVEVKYKVEAGIGQIAAGGAGATRFRLTGGGLGIGMAEIVSQELRADLQSTVTRYGTKSVDGSYPSELSVGTFDPLIEALFRSTFTAPSAITAATFTTLQPAVTSGNSGTFAAAAGSFITQGFRVGQIVRRTASNITANNGRNLRVTGITAGLLTFTTSDGLPITAGAADAAGTLDIQKRLVQPVAGGIVRRSFTFEEYNQDIDQSETFIGERVNSMHLAGGPDSMATVEFGLLGLDDIVQTTVNSPYFTSPTVSSSTPLTLADATIRLGGADIAVLTGVDFTLDNGQAGQATIGNRVMPDIFEGSATIKGTVTGIRQDLSRITQYLAETELELHILLTEPEAEPKDYCSFFLPRLKFGRVSAPIGQNPARIETMPFTAFSKDVVSGYDPTMILFETSAP